METGMKCIYYALLNKVDINGVKMHKSGKQYFKRYFLNAQFFDGFSYINHPSAHQGAQRIQMKNDIFSITLNVPYIPNFIDKIRLLFKKYHFMDLEYSEERQYIDVSMLT